MSQANENGKGSPMPPDAAMPCDAVATNEQANDGGRKERRRTRPPKMGRHSSGQARVFLAGRVHYLGPWGSPQAHENYARKVREWEANGSRHAERTPTAAQGAGLRVRELLDRWRGYLDEAGKYQKNDAPTSQRLAVDRVCKSLSAFAGNLLVTRMTEAVLVSWRDTIERNRRLTRTTINRQTDIVLQCLRWGRARGYVSKAVCADVCALERLQRGQVGDRPEHGRARRAVTVEEVEKVAAHASPQVAAMMKLQSLTGMRPGEVLALRGADIDKAGIEGDDSGAWVYRVPNGKTSHHGHATRYLLTKAAQDVIEAFPAMPLAFIFSPAEAMAERRQRLRAARKTPVQPSQQQRDENAPRDYATRWSIDAYRHAVERACKRAGVERFTPHEIRHGFVTWAANNLGLLAAAAAANHSNVQTTSRYCHTKDSDRLAVAAAVQKRAGG